MSTDDLVLTAKVDDGWPGSPFHLHFQVSNDHESNEAVAEVIARAVGRWGHNPEAALRIEISARRADEVALLRP